MPGLPTKMEFSNDLKDCLIWLDFISVPQLKARHVNAGDDGADDRANEFKEFVEATDMFVQHSKSMGRDSKSSDGKSNRTLPRASVSGRTLPRFSVESTPEDEVMTFGKSGQAMSPGSMKSKDSKKEWKRSNTNKSMKSDKTQRSSKSAPAKAQDIDELEKMLAAINSVPAYVKRCAIMIVLAPVVPHGELAEDCDFRSWVQRGWCRLESAIKTMCDSQRHLIVMESATHITLHG